MQPFKYRPRLNAGRLNRRISIQEEKQAHDDAGYPIPGQKEWKEVCKPWASREPIRGREFFAADAAQSEIKVRYKIRYRPGITADMRLVDWKDNRTYEIKAVLDDVYNDGTETHLMVAEVSNG
jgi:SPP1 family predicted phage head-tail adaptor